MVSIIIPVYNREKYIEECIRSIQAQSYKNYEIILIDDGSTDNTLSICRALAQEEPAIRILESGHLGVSAARNIGLEAVKGDFVFFLDSDDIIHPKLLETLVDALKGTDAIMSATARHDIWDQNWSKAYAHIEANPDAGDTIHHTFEESMDAMFGGPSPLGIIGGIMMRTDLIGETRFRTDLYIGEDFFFTYENLIKGGSTVFLKNKLYYARCHDQNLSWDLGYTGYMNRLLRRELVWKNEEALGRKKYATIQKNHAFGLYEFFMKIKTLPKEDACKIKKVARTYGKLLFPDLYFGNKVRYILFFCIPGGYAFAKALFAFWNKIRPAK